MIYLDSAATTLQKPPMVARAVFSAMSRMASPGRGGYPAAMAAANTILPVGRPPQICFMCRSPTGWYSP